MREFTARFATPQEVADWDTHVQANPRGGDMLQSASYADVKKHHGWRPVHLVHEPDDGSQPVYTLALEKSVPVVGRVWYIVRGPSVEVLNDLVGFTKATEAFIRESAKNVFLVKYEPVFLAGEEAQQTLTAAGLTKSFDIQPNDHTALLDTDREPDEIMAGMKSKGRNMLRRAEREGTPVERVELTEENMKTMFALMNTVGQGEANITLRPYEYYRKFWTNFAEAGQGRLYFVHEDGEPSMGAFVVNYGRHGTYKDGGSKPRRKQRGDGHLLQWRVINDLKNDYGIIDYDLCGTPPSDELKNEEHPLYGLGLFKTAFTKEVIDYVGVWDQEISPAKVALWNKLAEKVMRQLWVRSKHEPFY
ncbi:peptidoglycan bridge formation glycyltransferase FemA/FemB family protein [Kocuria sp. JC486]|uniref:lipid II:glycine glycyltransferase FemX n=1 Tax=Kocuria sp. JC486 TaxID=1970736 RepID=UPI00141FD72A|nr:peptidoglycan bridge formation glycyltransferase FemA/FemB family protein [Kocuria sp. JC486]NHU85227.1 peptidoglycan bridge formation glycyltransferase FemA/FemB family protein [Kocuria sp. JC486]